MCSLLLAEMKRLLDYKATIVDVCISYTPAFECMAFMVHMDRRHQGENDNETTHTVSLTHALVLLAQPGAVWSLNLRLVKCSTHNISLWQPPRSASPHP